MLGRLRVHIHAADRVHGLGALCSRAAVTMQIAAGIHDALRLRTLLYTPVGYSLARGLAQCVSRQPGIRLRQSGHGSQHPRPGTGNGVIRQRFGCDYAKVQGFANA